MFKFLDVDSILFFCLHRLWANVYPLPYELFMLIHIDKLGCRCLDSLVFILCRCTMILVFSRQVCATTLIKSTEFRSGQIISYNNLHIVICLINKILSNWLCENGKWSVALCYTILVLGEKGYLLRKQGTCYWKSYII